MSKWSACLSLLLSACLSSEGESALAPVDQQQALPASEVIDFASASTLANTDASGKSGGMTVLKTNSSNCTVGAYADCYAQYIEFSPSYTGYLSFNLSSLTQAAPTPAQVTQLSLLTKYQGPGVATSYYQWQLYRFSTSSWVSIANSQGRGDWVWTPALTLALPTTEVASNFVSSTGEIRARLIKGAGTDAAQLDSLRLQVSWDTGGEGPACTLPAFPKGTTWMWDLEHASIPTNLNAQVYVVDLFNTTPAKIQEYKAAGKKVVCYFSAGSYEDWRDDANQFPQDTYCTPGEDCAQSVHIMGDWCTSGGGCEWWLDHRKPAVRTVMATRMQLAKDKGCDAVEPDNIDGYSHDDEISCTDQSCWGLTAANQLDYNRWLATTAHSLCLGIALKNDVDQVPALADSFDFAINEECQKYNECGAYKTGFTDKNKAVFNAEYRVDSGGDTTAWTTCTGTGATCACGESGFAQGDLRTLVFRTASVRYDNLQFTCW
ncbi:endo alpha-1,4 polygalactosaminidase [Corallococcus sp. AS-1-12]|uniref:endo alpha-1,4 polygalactosaminidase n=1 Tax=Corallococcus sp. AS-1-12 TaxID=2874598 RepID=UPI001CBA8393|nr:endo alpha-1,4 polygalactosaminidase [Corallococcus sp. AS-1-12]MBZ4334996.1 endo alpha-1,4 polygalactosaminidase [Corallococcus sp. AS-1-12]